MFPLDGVRETDPSNGGYGYLEFSPYQKGYHEGVDYNAGAGAWADEGLPLLALGTQTLRWSGGDPSRGFGLHQWWELMDGPHAGAFLHYCHGESFAFEDAGYSVSRGETIGRCGHTGGSFPPHLHFVVTRCAPPSWTWYGAPGVPVEAIRAMTHDPADVVAAYSDWHDNGAPPVAQEDDVTPELQTIADAIVTSGYPASEVPALIAACKAWSANADSLAAWIEEIGALKARVAELEGQLAATSQAVTDANNANA